MSLSFPLLGILHKLWAANPGRSRLLAALAEMQW